MFYAQSAAKCHIRAKQNAFLPQVQILIQSYILIYCTLRKREPLIALGSYQGVGGALISAFAHTTHTHGRTDARTDGRSDGRTDGWTERQTD